MKPFVVLFALFLPVAGTSAVTIDTLRIGNPGNAPDLSGFGSVANEYRIGKLEVTNAKYTEFLNAVDPSGANTLGLYFPFYRPNGGINFNGGAAAGCELV